MNRAGPAALVAAAVGAIALLAWTWSRPDLEVRSTAWLVQTGHTFAAGPPGQTFVRGKRLSRVELLVTDIGEAPPGELELVLRMNGPQGHEVGRSLGSSYREAPLGGWLGFDFEEIVDSGGAPVHVELRPAGERESSHVAVWTRLRGNPAGNWTWGSDSRSGPVVEGELLSEQPDLRGLAFACRRVEGPVSLVLLDGEDGRELDRSTLELPAPVVDGWIAFPLERRPDSRWRRYGYRLELPASDELVAVGRVPTSTAWHGSGRVDGALGGATLGGHELAERDLVLRAYGSSGPFTVFMLLITRMMPQLVVVLIFWLAASSLLWLALPRED